MPAIDVRILEGVFTGEEKARLITRLTDAFRIQDFKSGNWGYAGQPLDTENGLATRRKG